MPLAIDLYCGLGGWTEGLLAEGYDVIGFDIERHDYGDGKRYPAQLVLQDVLTLHGRQFKDAALIVASPPCQEYSYMAMPWSRAKAIAAEYREGKRDVKKLTALFDACFRIQREAIEAAGHFIPLVVENVRGACAWVGRSRWNYGSFHLWGDVPALMPMTRAIKNNGGSWFNIGSPGQKETNRNPVHELVRQKTRGLVNIRDGYSHTRHLTNQREHEGLKVPGNNGPRLWSEREVQRLCDAGRKNGNDWFGSSDNCSLQRRASSKSDSRKAASASIAKIPFPLAQHIARSWLPV